MCYNPQDCVDLLLSYGADVNVSMGVSIYNNMNSFIVDEVMLTLCYFLVMTMTVRVI